MRSNFILFEHIYKSYPEKLPTYSNTCDSFSLSKHLNIYLFNNITLFNLSYY